MNGNFSRLPQSVGLFRPMFPGRIEFGKVVFLWREENPSTLRKTLVAGKRKNKKLNPHTTLTPKIEPGPHWWEASALTTVSSLLNDIFYSYLS